MGDSYTPINTKGSPTQGQDIDIELEAPIEPVETLKEVDLGPADEVVIVDKDLEIELDSDEDEDVKIVEPELEEKPAPKKKRGSYNTKTKKRDKRIKQLVEKANNAEAATAQKDQEIHDLKAQLSNNHKTANQTNATSLQSQVAAHKIEMQVAMDDSDSAALVEAQGKLMEAQVQLMAVKHDLTNHEDVPEYIPTTTTTNQGPDERTVDWVEDHPEFNKDPIFNASALAVNSSLLQEGYNPDSDEFYEELDSRLGKRFPDFYDISSEDVLQSKKTSNSHSSQSEETVTEPDNENIDYPQTVSGASRTPTGSASAKRRKSKNTVILTPEDQQMCEQWGISPQAMARRKQLQEKTAKGDYVPIKIG